MLSRKRLGGMLWDLNPTGILYLFNAARSLEYGSTPPTRGPPWAPLGTPRHPWEHGGHPELHNPNMNPIIVSVPPGLQIGGRSWYKSPLPIYGHGQKYVLVLARIPF